MGRMGVIRWEKAVPVRPSNNIVSSDFPKYVHQPWKFMEGKSQVALLLSYEYHRMWLLEREAWQKRMYPENVVQNIDIVKHYVLTFKHNVKRPKPIEKKTFKMKKFEGIPSKTNSTRSADDKAMAFMENKH